MTHVTEIPPLVVTFEVAAPPAEAFDTWVSRAKMWWPATHTVSQAPQGISFGPGEGADIVETAADGARHVWGRITAWEPPHRLGYSWHLFFDPAEATDVEVEFTPIDGGTRVTLTQTGWDRLGDEGVRRRERNTLGWGAVTSAFARFVADGET